MELLLPHLDGTLMNQVNNVKTDGETNKQTIVAHTFPPYRHRLHKWLEPQRSAGLQNVYLDPSYLVLGTQHNPSASRSIYMRKNCLTWKGYPTRHGKTTRPSESLALRDEFAIFMWMVG